MRSVPFRLFSISILVAAFSLSAHAASTREGLVGEQSTVPAQQRSSIYSGAPAGNDTALQSTGKKHAAGAQKGETDRQPLQTLSQNSSWFRIFDAGVFLRDDADDDGYHSEFEVRFDADSYIGNARVYAKLYLRRVGDRGGWQHYHTTEDFWLYGSRSDDHYFVTTVLDDGFATGEYDVLIDLYESGYSGIVATRSAYEDASLESLPLEERGLDVPIELPGFSILGVNTSLLIDDDRDGYFSRFRVSFDPDSDVGATVAYAVVWIRAPGGDWIKEHESDDFVIDSTGSADAYSFTADWLSGYPTAEYDLQLDLYDSSSGLLIASAGSDRAEFSRIPLEDADRDRMVTAAPVVVTTTTTTSHEHGGGSLSMISAMLLLGLAVVRRVRSSNP